MSDSEVESRVARFMLKYEMTAPGDNIIIGFSGGADSVCLLFILNKLKNEVSDFSSLKLHAVHLNHSIRGDEAKRDEEFVKEFCGKISVPVTTVTEDIPAIARETGESEETAGRRIRYELFRKKIKELNGGVTATAHHKNDSAETVLFNMARGTGLAGITGIAPKRDGIIRPLMCLTRKVIEDYVEENDLEYVTDSTNSDTAYTRNFIRHEVIAPIEENINKNFIAHVNNLSETARKYKTYVDGQADEFIRGKAIVNKRDSLVFLKKDLDSLPDILLETIVMKAYRHVSKDGLDLSSERIEAAVEGIRSGGTEGVTIEMPKGAVLRISGGEAEFYGKEEKTETKPFFFMTGELKERLETMGSAGFEYDGYTIILEITDDFTKNTNSDYTKYFNYDKMTSNTCFRKRLPGDMISIDSEGSKKKLKKEFIDRKIPERIRENCLIMAEGSSCLWAVGVRQSTEAFADKDSAVLKITVKETETDIL